MSPWRPVLRRSLLVAAVATLAAGVLLAVVLAVSDSLFSHNSSVDLDTELRNWYLELSAHPVVLDQMLATGRMPTGIVLWRLDSAGRVVGTAGVPAPLPDAYHGLQGGTIAFLQGTKYRLVGGPLPDGWLVLGGDAAIALHPQQNVQQAQLITLPPALVAVFLGALAVGRWVAGPIERARRQQLAFVANASHELRTPLAVLEGEVSLARSRPRAAQEYREALDRVAGETANLSALVDHLLWLARFESEPGPPATERVSLAEAASRAGARFAAVAEQRGLDLSVVAEPAVVEAPGPWIDQLLGVLLANACRYTPRGGRVQVTVVAGVAGPGLLIDDSGPGVPPEERSRIFERFYRASGQGEGAGLGLSIGDAIVQATRGVWQVTRSPLGGARFQVRWPPRRPGPLPAPLRR